jgi:hypothetical protein
MAAGLAAGVALLLAGRTPARTPSPTPSLSSTATTVPTATPTAAVSTLTASPGSAEAKIVATIQAYSDYLNRAFTDPTVRATEAARYLADEPPDFVFEAIQRKILEFRADGYRQTGTAPIHVTSVAPAANGAYTAAVCQVSDNLSVTDAKGQPVYAGPPRSSAQYTLILSKDGNWRISKIQGTGTAC